MSRLALVFDRMMVFLIGIGLFALGLGAVAWQRGVLWQGGPVDLSALTAVTGTSWWPWAQAAAGVLLVLAALRWLMAHHQAPRLTRLPLPDEQGLSADPNARVLLLPFFTKGAITAREEQDRVADPVEKSPSWPVAS